MDVAGAEFIGQQYERRIREVHRQGFRAARKPRENLSDNRPGGDLPARELDASDAQNQRLARVKGEVRRARQFEEPFQGRKVVLLQVDVDHPPHRQLPHGRDFGVEFRTRIRRMHLRRRSVCEQKLLLAFHGLSEAQPHTERRFEPIGCARVTDAEVWYAPRWGGRCADASIQQTKRLPGRKSNHRRTLDFRNMFSGSKALTELWRAIFSARQNGTSPSAGGVAGRANSVTTQS
jgi:hypothetical protein